MTQPTYRVTCPLDKLTLLPVVLGPDSAPWFCVGCRTSYWAAELSETARKQYRPAVRDFGYGAPLEQLQRDVEAEIAEAVIRGTSCREDQIGLLPMAGLQRLVDDPRIHGSFRPLVTAELTRKGG